MEHNLNYNDLVRPYLMHHGINGMKWGIRRYQNKDGTLTEAGKKRYGTVEALEKHQQEKAEKKQAKTEAKAAAKEESHRLHEEWYEGEKAKAIASGNPREMLKYVDTMSTEDIKNAINRVKTIQELDALRNKTLIERGKEALKESVKQATTKKITEMILGKDDSGSTERNYSSDAIKAAKDQAAKAFDKAFKEAKAAGKSDSEAAEAGTKAHKHVMGSVENAAKKGYQGTKSGDDNQNDKDSYSPFKDRETYRKNINDEAASLGRDLRKKYLDAGDSAEEATRKAAKVESDFKENAMKFYDNGGSDDSTSSDGFTSSRLLKWNQGNFKNNVRFLASQYEIPEEDLKYLKPTPIKKQKKS